MLLTCHAHGMQLAAMSHATLWLRSTGFCRALRCAVSRCAIDALLHALQQAAVDIADFAAAAGKPVIRFAEQDGDVHPAFELPAVIVHTAKQCVPDPNAEEVPTWGHPPKVRMQNNKREVCTVHVHRRCKAGLQLSSCMLPSSAY